jgi:ElaB/YqjD/DUF883 family membrane-anchored ribosome-binding protein
MKNFKKKLQAVDKDLKALIKKTEALIKSVDRIDKQKAVQKPKAKAVPSVKKGGQKTAFETIMGIIYRSRKGVTVAQLKEKSGFDPKKIANIIYKGKKRGNIKSIDKGVYLKA